MVSVNPTEVMQLNLTPKVPSERSLIAYEEPEDLFLAAITLEGPERPPWGLASDVLENEPFVFTLLTLRD